jgi:hypothetical protein
VANFGYQWTLRAVGEDRASLTDKLLRILSELFPIGIRTEKVRSAPVIRGQARILLDGDPTDRISCSLRSVVSTLPERRH